MKGNSRIHIAFLTLLMIVADPGVDAEEVNAANARAVLYVIPAYRDDTINPILLAEDVAKKLKDQPQFRGDKTRVQRSTSYVGDLLKCPRSVCGSCRCDVVGIFKENTQYFLTIKCCNKDFNESSQKINLSLPRGASSEQIRRALTDKVSAKVNTHDSRWHSTAPIK